MPFNTQEKRDEYMKEYYLKNKDKRLKYNKEYYKTPQRYKTSTICSWKVKGLIDDYEKIYQIYLDTHECMKCNISISGRNKHMDHDHITNLFRAVLCASCNTGNTLDTKCSKNNTTGIKYICKTKDGYRFQKTIKGKKHGKWFKTLEEAIEYKEQYLLEFC